jgi:DNA polymerase III subunit delta
MAAQLKPAYLIHGDDHGAIAERRAGLRALVEREPGGGASVEVLDGDDATPAGVARALTAMTLAIGWRVIVVDGVERWRDGDVEGDLKGALAALPPDTTVALFAREDARAKAPAGLAKAVQAAGGQVVAQSSVKPWELPAWVRKQASGLGLALDAAAAKALVRQVGERQQRLLRELETLALEGERADLSQPRAIAAEEIEQRAAHSTEWRAYTLADALVAGERAPATLTYVRLRAQGERIAGLTYLLAQRLRDAVAIAERLQQGASPAEIKRTLRMPARAAERLIADVAHSDADRLRGALGTLADLELDSRGGAPLTASRSSGAGLAEDTLAVRAIDAIAG